LPSVHDYIIPKSGREMEFWMGSNLKEIPDIRS